MPQIKIQIDVEPIGIIFFGDPAAAYPGWYLQHTVGGQVVTTRLHYYDEWETDMAVIEAADLLGCVPDAIEIQT